MVVRTNCIGQEMVETWRLAAEDLEQIRRKELRELDSYKAISLLCHSADYTKLLTHLSPGPVSWRIKSVTVLDVRGGETSRFRPLVVRVTKIFSHSCLQSLPDR